MLTLFHNMESENVTFLCRQGKLPLFRVSALLGQPISFDEGYVLEMPV